MSDQIRQIIRNQKTLVGHFPTFDVSQLPKTPQSLFYSWFSDAVKHEVFEPHVMTLSTINQIGQL